VNLVEKPVLEDTHMRTARPSALVCLSLGVALVAAGCGGHSGTSPSASSTTPVAPSRVVSVAPAALDGTSPIIVTFRRPLSPQSAMPTLSPPVPGRWVRSGATATFTPAQAFPPNTTFTLKLVRKPGAVAKVIAQRSTGDGSIKFAEQILARLHYLPVDTSAPAPADAAAEAAAVYHAPKGHFSWRFTNVPQTLQKDWVAGKPNSVLRGAVIAFQHHAHLTMDGAIGPKTWAALEQADLSRELDPDKYSYVYANLYLPQRLSVWVDGHTAVTSPVNGGVAGAPTPLGTYPVYERFTATTMQGTNPDGSHYKDPGVPWVNYFSGGSAVHGFPRASYGSPQSVGCLELPISTAKQVYKLIGYGTLVTVSGPYVPKTVAKPAPPRKPKPKPSRSSSPAASPAASPTASHQPKR
jgi:peptidoglycan hydrolase-like protein with peptidoglycan-binding domain